MGKILIFTNNKDISIIISLNIYSKYYFIGRLCGGHHPSDNNILPTPFLTSFRPNPSDQDRSYLRSDGLRQYGYVIQNTRLCGFFKKLSRMIYFCKKVNNP